MQSRHEPLRAIRGLGAIFLFGVICSVVSGQALPARLRQTLTAELQASEESLRTLEGGGIAAYAIDSESPSRIKLVGMIRIWATPESFVRSYQNIDAFESVPGVSASRKFHVPPIASDLERMAVTAAEAAELKACVPGSCTFKLDDAGMRKIRDGVKWGSGDEAAQASGAMRQFWLERLKKYQLIGNAGLPVYDDAPDSYRVEAGVQELISDSRALQEYAPQLVDYLRKYPRSRNRPTETFFYWQSGTFGLKPVDRVSHVAIQRTSSTYGDAFVIASKMLFANHYFRSGLELRYLIPGQDQKTGGMHYLVLVQSSEVDGMEGWPGRLLRPVAVAKSLTAMEKYLGTVKERVEREFAASASSGTLNPPE